MKVEGKGFTLYNTQEELSKDFLEEGKKMAHEGNYQKAFDNFSDAIIHLKDFSHLQKSMTRGIYCAPKSKPDVVLD